MYRVPPKTGKSGKIRFKKRNLTLTKKKKKCARCGFDDPRALHFHHLDPKIRKDQSPTW